MFFKTILASAVLSVSGMNFASASTMSFNKINILDLHDEEVRREKKGEAPRFAVVNEVSISPVSEVVSWTKSADNKVTWSKRIHSPGVVSLNFAFEKFKLPVGATLDIYSKDGLRKIRTFTSNDNNKFNALWTPVIESDDVMIELNLPADKLSELELSLTKVNQGFRKFSQKTQKSGGCNVDVVCSEGDEWRNEINSVAVISTGGSTFCTGFLVNNTSNDRTPYFMTAAHCRITNQRSATSLVTYWNYQASACGGDRDGKKQQFTTGAEMLASDHKSDFALVKLNQQPDEEFGVQYAGWDRSGDDATTAIAIHHPATDEKAISFEYDATTITSYLKTEVPGDSTHVRVEDWDVGTTEPGSSGSPLFNQEHRVIGQLHGGWASCRSETADYYGRFFTSWEGSGEKTSRLKDHLDSAGTGDIYVDTIK